MKILLQPPKLMVAWRRHVLVFASLGLLSACANSDFGEVNPVLVTDGIHDWIGRDRSANPVPPSKFEYTDDERALRDNAYPLIEPPFDRQQWYSVAGEYGLIRFNIADYRKYYDRLVSDWHRSPSSRYAKLIDDIRNDTTRLSQFFETAGRVMDIDQKRQKSLPMCPGWTRKSGSTPNAEFARTRTWSRSFTRASPIGSHPIASRSSAWSSRHRRRKPLK